MVDTVLIFFYYRRVKQDLNHVVSIKIKKKKKNTITNLNSELILKHCTFERM